MDAQPIENHGIIGDLHTAALVGMDGSIDFMCFPRFDSPTIFAALLDPEKGGRFQIAPAQADRFRHKQLYFPDTNMLLTRFLSDDGVAEISDFMPIQHLGHAMTWSAASRSCAGRLRCGWSARPDSIMAARNTAWKSGRPRCCSFPKARTVPRCACARACRFGSRRAMRSRNSSCAPEKARRLSWRRCWRARNRRRPRPIIPRNPSRRR